MPGSEIGAVNVLFADASQHAPTPGGSGRCEPLKSPPKTSTICATATEDHGSHLQAEGRGPFPAVVDLHGGAWCNGDLTGPTASTKPRLERRCRRRAQLSPCRGRLSDVARRHQLRDPLAQGACRRAEGRSAPSRHRRRVERRPPGDAGGDAAQRPALHRDPSAGGCAPSMPRSRRSSMQWPVINPLSRYRNANRLRRLREPPAWVGRHAGEARPLLEDRGRDGRGQPDADPRARREGRVTAGVMDPGPARPRPRLSRPGFDLRRQRARAIRLAITARPAATSRSSISTTKAAVETLPTTRLPRSSKSASGTGARPPTPARYSLSPQAGRGSR